MIASYAYRATPRQLYEVCSCGVSQEPERHSEATRTHDELVQGPSAPVARQIAQRSLIWRNVSLEKRRNGVRLERAMSAAISLLLLD